MFVIVGKNIQEKSLYLRDGNRYKIQRMHHQLFDEFFKDVEDFKSLLHCKLKQNAKLKIFSFTNVFNHSILYPMVSDINNHVQSK